MLKRLVFVLGATLLAFAAAAQPMLYQEGKQYFRIEPTQPTNTPGKVEVIEVFSYACIHCANFQPVVEQWKKTMPKDASFSYMPAVFNPTWETFARAYYAAEAMGVLDKTHGALFDAVFVEKLPLQTVNDVAKFFERYGKSADEALKAMNSFGVRMKMDRAKKQVLAYQVDSTPTVVVNGKWRVTGASAGSHEALFKVVDHLVRMEAATLPKAPVAQKPKAAAQKP